MYRNRRSRSSGILVPFLAILSFFIVIIMGFQIWNAFFVTVKGDAIYYTAEGRSRLLPFGQNDWEYANNGIKVKLGDSIKTLNGAKGVISFYDGTLVRLNSDTEVNLVDITKNGDSQQILLTLVRGQIWINKPNQKLLKKTDFVIQGNLASYSITGTIFDLDSSGILETLRVVRGEVDVDIMKEVAGKNRVAHTITVGLGQKTELDKSVVLAFQNGENPSVLSELDNEFKNLAWYLWNMAEDMSPTDFSSTSFSVDNGINGGNVQSGLNQDNLEKSIFPTPRIIEPANLKIKSEEDSFLVKGTVQGSITKMLVKQKLAGSDEVEKILISGFNPSEGTFSYAISLNRGNVKSGLNLYEFVGVDDSALETDPAILEIDYFGSATVSSVDVSDNDTMNNNTLALTVPSVITVDGFPYKEGMSVKNSTFRITGAVKGADKLFVDNYQLSRFNAGDTSWSYNVSTALGNLVKGKNSFNVVAEDSSGKKSPVLTIVIDFTGELLDSSQTNSTNSISKEINETLNLTEFASVSADTTSDNGSEDPKVSQDDQAESVQDDSKSIANDSERPESSNDEEMKNVDYGF